MKIKKYPLDFGWILIGIAGVFYMVDTSNILGLREEFSLLQFFIGLSIFMAAAFAFMTERNDLAGSLFASSSFWTLLAGVFELNWALFLSSFAFLYANYLIGKVETKAQSDYSLKTSQEKNAENLR